MKAVTRRIGVKTQGNGDIVDITEKVTKEISLDVKQGLVTVFVVGSTAAVATIENESGLLTDFREMWDRLVPRGQPYHHDRAWGDGNGFSHLRASLLSASLTIPLVDGSLALGTWQQIVLVDFDNRPRSREVLVQILGE